MNVQQITKVLEPITDKSLKPKRSLTKVAFRNGHGYACDGRIAMRIRLDDPNKEIPEEDGGCYPFLVIDDLMLEVDKQDKWYMLDAEALKDVTGKFAEVVRNEDINRREMFDSRYVECECPHCGETVWFDTDDETIVEERVKDEPVDPKLVYYPGLLKLGDEKVVVGFGYIQAITVVIGRDAQFALGDEREDGNRILLFRSYDGSIAGALMPIRVEQGALVHTVNWEIKCREVTNA